ncbi:hypothetical protein SEA_WARREN_53 [Microbacterium phage Warren]|nr:hypothetical protein SEA_WARREN_53 [Microbacterium phage Warren]
MRRDKSFEFGRWVGRYIVGPLLVLVIIGALVGLIALLVVGIGNTLGA